MQPHSDNGTEAERQTRLESWKQIAAYLNRDVRTAHRWERHENLPVHRHLHSKRGTVYAYPSEIDAWLNERTLHRNGEPVPATHKTRLLRITATGVGLIVAVGAASWLSRPTPELEREPLSLLVAASDNRSGESRLDGVIDSWLQSQLSGPGLNLIPPNKISETLTLMRQTADREPNRMLMLEIGARNPDADLVITSALDRFGEDYLLSVALIDPISGSTIDMIRSEASGEDAIPAALDALVARTLASIDAVDQPRRLVPMGYEPVTTTSSRAAEHYWEASRLMFDAPYRIDAAEEQLRQALAFDPEFATALIQIAHAIHEQGKPASEWRTFADRAFQLADTISPSERLFVVGSYHKLLGNLDEAQTRLFALNDAYPKHFWGQVQMAEISHAQGNLNGAAWSMALAADLRPEAIEFQQTAMDFILTTPHAWTAERIHERMLELNPPSANGNIHPSMRIEFFWVNRLLLDGNAAEALDALDTLRRKLDTLPDNVWTKRSGYAARLAEVYLTLGRLEDAERLLQIVLVDDTDVPRNTPAIRLGDEQRLLSLLAVSRGKTCCDAGEFDTLTVVDGIVMGIRAGRQDLGPLANAIIASDSPLSRILQGEIAYRTGDLSRSIELLSEVLNNEIQRLSNLGLAPGPVQPSRREFYLAANTLASELLDAGRPGEAIRVLEQWSDERAKTMAFMVERPFAPYWIRLRSRLEKLYREAGRDEEASAIRSYLSSLLVQADQDHQFL